MQENQETGRMFQAEGPSCTKAGEGTSWRDNKPVGLVCISQEEEQGMRSERWVRACNKVGLYSECDSGF